MITVTKKFNFPIGHCLLNYDGPCANIHGHNIDLEVTFGIRHYMSLDNAGFVIDFNEIKKGIGSWVEESFDHAFFVNPMDASMLKLLMDRNSKHIIMPNNILQYGDHTGLYNPTMENIALIIGVKAYNFAHLKNLIFIKVRLYESDTSFCEIEL